jgi:glutaredoxin 2
MLELRNVLRIDVESPFSQNKILETFYFREKKGEYFLNFVFLLYKTIQHIQIVRNCVTVIHEYLKNFFVNVPSSFDIISFMDHKSSPKIDIVNLLLN